MRANAAHIQEFADDLKNYNEDSRVVRPDKVNKILHDIQLMTECNASIAKEIEFLAKGEISNDTFLKRFEEIKIVFEPKLANITS